MSSHYGLARALKIFYELVWQDGENIKFCPTPIRPGFNLGLYAI